ncbi:MAG: hypothetical protein SCARUB_04277 [Candidatus Scalindua rubra]|uniref:Uncharacterized protein n=1 Tax=Candidatus Scalindua rubra TaxID=1872076 RepID=A0A1E3X4S0_9BACT|nr:MAG: hypothetical protein SCARUB_04277 [Candidatus Scalindua rubra]
MKVRCLAEFTPLLTFAACRYGARKQRGGLIEKSMKMDKEERLEDENPESPVETGIKLPQKKVVHRGIIKRPVYKKKRPPIIKVTGFEKRTLDRVKEAEDAVMRQLRRRHYSVRAMRRSGRVGIGEDEVVNLFHRRMLISEEYARDILKSLYDKGFLTKTKYDLYALSQSAIESIGYLLRKRGYVSEAVRKILRRELASRGYIRELAEHKAPTRTKVLPPIIGYFK